MAKTKAQYLTVANQQKGKSYNDVAVGRFRGQHETAETAQQALEASRNKNMMIEEVLMRIKDQNPDLEGILNNMIGW